jgi:murein DD-endopeptidase MepM/ murein hydrolase activator NlpD
MRWSAACATALVTLVTIAGSISLTGAQTRAQRSGRVTTLATARSAFRPDARLQGNLAALRARRPVQGKVTSDFGARRSVWGKRFHAGIDLAARRGTPVRAPGAGTVAFAGWRNGYGRTIVVDHGNRLQTLYAHLSKVSVRPGQPVRRGTSLGLTGATGRTSGPHLHYEVLVNGRPVDPHVSPPGRSSPRRANPAAKQLPKARPLANLPSG